jgi:hypothetical protein
MTSDFIIKYNSNPLGTDSFSIQDGLTPLQLILVDYGLSTVDFPLLGTTIDETILYTYQFLESAYNNTNLYTITPDYINNEISVVATNVNSSFTEESNNTSGRVTNTINNVVAPTVFTIDSITTSEADSLPCTNVKLTITTNVQATDITSPIIDTVATNPYIVDVQRTGRFNVTLNDSNNSDTETVYIPSLVAADFSADVVLAPNGGTVTVNNNYIQTPLFDLEYSLDNVIFYASNSFSGLAVGSYTVYVRDSLGCDFSLDFDIDEFTPQIDERVQYSFVSNSGSFRFKICEDFSTNIKTVENTLSYEENVQNPELNYKQPYQISDGIITQQFKSSYEVNEVVYIDSNNDEFALAVDQKSQNLNIEDVRDGTVISATYEAQQYVALQFGSGNTYDPVTLLPNGTYSLGNSLPDWIDIGEYLNIQNAGWIKVRDIIVIDGVSTAIMDALVASYPESIPQQGLVRRVVSYYNQLNYEVYQFSLDLSTLNGCYQIRIDLTDSEFTATSYLSERIEVLESQPKTHLFEWYNTENNEINYSFGIRNKARFKYIYNFEWLPNSTNDVYVADTNTIQIDSTVREFYLVRLNVIPTAMAQKFILLCANDRVFGDSISFIKETEAETRGFNGTNVYEVTQQLTKANYIFDSLSSDGSISINSGTPLAIEGLGDGLLYIE